MKHFLGQIAMVMVLASCSNGGNSGEGVGDSLTHDPTTAQPITTEPDTVGPDAADTTLNQNQ